MFLSPHLKAAFSTCQLCHQLNHHKTRANFHVIEPILATPGAMKRVNGQEEKKKDIPIKDPISDFEERLRTSWAAG